MKSHWINKKDHPSVIVFFTGWGMKPLSTGHLGSSNHDLLVIYDYTNMDFPEADTIKNYTDITVVAWSMGVMAASYVMGENLLKPTKTIAINGTAIPVSDQYGIPSALYFATINTLSESTLKKFLTRMCGSKSVYDQFMQQHMLSDIEDLKRELVAIEQHQKRIFTPMWDYAILGKKDFIFSFENMEYFWKDKAKQCIITDDVHYPFFQWGNWKELVDLCNKERNG